MARKKKKAVYDYADCSIDADTYIGKLHKALDQLDVYDAQLDSKIDSGKIKDNEASSLKARSDNLYTTINGLINDAMMP